MIVTLILTGRLLELSARHRSSAGVERLLACAPAQALRLRGGEAEIVATAELVAGDLVLVREGERFPVDGMVLEGETEVDESPATGESLPVLRRAGDPVIAGSINLLGGVRVRVEHPAADSFVARIARLVEEAQQRRAPIQNLVERVSAHFVPAVLALAAGTFGYSLLVSGAPFNEALMKALAVVVIACPCALGLATPTAIVAGTGAAASAGFIFRGGDILERLSRVRRVAFDKTGTLTEGRPVVLKVMPVAGIDEYTLVAACAGVEAASTHPLARGIRDYADAGGIGYTPAAGFLSEPGGGIAGAVAGRDVAAGSARFLAGRGVPVPEATAVHSGASLVHVARDGEYLGAISLRDRLRAEARPLVDYLTGQGIATVLLSGDRQEHAAEIADEAGISEVRGGLLPPEKAEYVISREGEGEPVLMVGDGINDAPALSAASVGCAMAGGTDIALETSTLVLARPDLGRIRLAHLLSVRTMRVIRQNLAWAFVYNLIGIPLAMSGRLTPIYAAAAMALSSLCVVGNSLRLTRLKHG
jgi:Cu2+-exporting ATPase